MFLSANPPHIICLTEHHLGNNEINTVALTNHSLGAKFCNNTFKNGGVHIFTYESIQFTDINIDTFCKEKNLEICAVKLHLPSSDIRIITIYRSPSGNFQYFRDNLEKIVSLIYCNNTEIIICGDINTFTAIIDLSRFNNSYLKSPASTLADLTFQSRALRSFSLNQLCNLSL